MPKKQRLAVDNEVDVPACVQKWSNSRSRPQPTGAVRTQNTEAALELAVKKYATILATVQSGFWLFDMEGRLLEVNDAYCRMSGYRREELLHRCIRDLEANESNEDILSHIQRVRERGHDEFESRHRRKDGTVFDVDICATYLDFEGGRLVVLVRDITDRKRAEQILWQSGERFKLLSETAGRLLEAESPQEVVERVVSQDHGAPGLPGVLQLPGG